MPRPTAVRFGLAAAASLAALYAIGSLWNPVTIVPAAVFSAAFVGLLRGKAWSGYGCALFLLAAAVGAVVGDLRLGASHMPAGAMVTLVLFAAAFAFLLFRAGRALPASPGGRAPWLVVAAAVLLFASTMKPFIVPSVAMENTLLLGDQMYVRVAGPYTPARGDIVILRYPVDPNQIFTKRIVAVGGDRVRFQNKTLVLNGVPQNEPYARHTGAFLDSFRDNFPAEPNVRLPLEQWAAELPTHIVDGDLVVPQGKYFVLGDNRDNSLDSRYWGFLDRAAIIGRPAFIYFSAERSAEDAQAPQLATPVLFTPSRIRWSRMLHPVR